MGLSRRTLLVLLLGALACGGRGESRPYQTELTEPWLAAGVPVGEGRVIRSSQMLLIVHYDGGDVGALTDQWSTALQAAGFTRGSDTSAEDMRSITWSDSAAVVALGVLRTGERAEVSLTRYPR